MQKLHESMIPTLTPDEELAISKLKSRIKAELGALHLYLFGSKARGDYTRDSDVDLMVVASCEKNFENRGKLSDIQYDVIIEIDAPIMCKLESIDNWLHGEFVPLREVILKEGIEIEL